MSEPQHSPLLDLTVLDRYLVGEASATECEQVERWLAVDPIRAQRLHSLTMVGGRYDAAQADMLDVDQAWSKVRHARDLAMASRGRHDQHRFMTPVGGASTWVSPSHRMAYSVVALMVCVMIMIGWTVHVHHNDQRTAAAASVYTTGNGQRATITLPDGSTVALNATSRLEVPGDYAAGHLTVQLMGEAVFTISHHERTPFIVNTDNASVKVLGTSFLVRHYATDSVTRVAVQDGKVMIRSSVLTMHQQVDVNQSGMTRFSRADSTQFSFVRGLLTLNGVLFPEAIAELDRWYDADIRLGDPSLATRRVAGECAAGSIGDLANVLELTFDVRVMRNGRVLTLYPR